MKRIKYVNTVIIVIIIFCAGTLSAQEIVFTQQINNNDNIMVMDASGNLKKITSHSRKDSGPMISPDGKTLVFTSERIGWWKIWTLDLQTRVPKQLTNSGRAEYAPVWSPESNRIAFISERDGNQDIFVMNKDGSSQKNITNSNNSEIYPYWSGDGYIYFSSEADSYYQIARCRPDGSNYEIITNGPGDKLMPQPSQDGKKILFHGNLDGNLELYIYDIESKEAVRLTNHPLMDMRARWSDGNDKIVFERGNKGDNHHIYIMNSDGSNVRKLTKNSYNYSPSFVPQTISFFD